MPRFPGVLFAGALIAGVLVGASVPWRAALQVRDLDGGGRVVAVLPLAAAPGFVLTFTHSMYGGAVVERYSVRPEATNLERAAEIYTQHAGAAEYYALYGNFRQEHEGWWTVETPPLRLAQLTVRVDHVGQPVIQVGDRAVGLLDLVPAGHRAELRPRMVVSFARSAAHARSAAQEQP